MVSGKLLLTDSTHILANAAKEKREIIEVPDTPSEYVRKLDREALEAGLLDEPVTYPEKTKTVPLVCLRYEPDTTGKGRKCGLFSLFGCDFSRVIPLGGICQQHRNATPFRDLTKLRTTNHRAEYFSFYPYYRTHLFNECVRIFVAFLPPGGYIKIRTHKSSIL